jgi:hypothetical protein
LITGRTSRRGRLRVLRRCGGTTGSCRRSNDPFNIIGPVTVITHACDSVDYYLPYTDFRVTILSDYFLQRNWQLGGHLI